MIRQSNNCFTTNSALPRWGCCQSTSFIFYVCAETAAVPQIKPAKMTTKRRSILEEYLHLVSIKVGLFVYVTVE